ncbi:odorant receptor 13a-like [Topomyia yanbarensis]|uniref:odorant receptor 13a-like n=1 Tax=Topomyia yanbarensis TaxID=2498891 RepID=UPI00273ADA15|nr:odorant receptor 13a-like [Topomyia yanbarensis]
MVGYIVTIWIGPKIVLGSGKEGFDSFIRNIAEVIFLSENCITIVLFTVKNRTFERLVDVLERILQRRWPKHLEDEIESFNRRMETVSKIYAIYIFVLLIVFVSVPILSTAIKLIFLDAADRGDFTLSNETQFYWLNIRRKLSHYAVFTFFCFPASCCSAFIITMKGTIFQVVIYYGSKLFDLLAKRIDVMADLANDEDERRKELREIVQLHQLVLEYLDHLESTMSFILMNQIMSCLLVWCLMLFYVSTNFGADAANLILLFVILMGEMAIYCINGNILSDKAAEVAHAMYRYPWYREPADVQRTIRLIIQRAQKPTGVTAAKFYFVNIERFGATVQATYSYYLMLKNTF